MKDSKYCRITACCWDYRHELLGLILLIIATFLTIITCNTFGIIAMFLVGGVMCCYRQFCCHAHHHDNHCHSMDHCGDKDSTEGNEAKKPANKSKK
ncbi:MAG: hypothetical protein NTW94_06895 [Legionellales bacterium]|nr:hypothetical protein [Legionellales bacterium]